jgi:hypothetical protein
MKPQRIPDPGNQMNPGGVRGAPLDLLTNPSMGFGPQSLLDPRVKHAGPYVNWGWFSRLYHPRAELGRPNGPLTPWAHFPPLTR